MLPLVIKQPLSLTELRVLACLTKLRVRPSGVPVWHQASHLWLLFAAGTTPDAEASE